MRFTRVLLLALCFFIVGRTSLSAIPQSDIDTLLGVSYTVGAPAVGLLLFGLLDGDVYDQGYGDYSLLAGASFVTGTMEADGGSGKAGGIGWQIARFLSHSYDEEDRLFGFLIPGNEISGEILIPLPLADADPRDAFFASFAATICHYDPISLGANIIFYELEDGPVPFRISCGIGDTYKLPLTNEFYVRPSLDLKLFDSCTIHAEFYKTLFGRAFLGETAKLRPSQEYRVQAGVGYNLTEKSGLRLTWTMGESARYEQDNMTGLNRFTYNAFQLFYSGRW